MMVLSIVVLLALLGVVFYRVNLTLSSLITVAYTAAMGAIGLWSFWLLLPLAIVLLPLNLSSLRRSCSPHRRCAPSAGDAADVHHREGRRSTPAPHGGKAICSAARRTGTSCTATRNRA